MRSIGERLYELRTSRGLSQEDVAAGANISRVALTRYENGQRMPKMDIVSRLASFFNVSTAFLVGEEGFDIEKQEDLGLSAEDREALNRFLWLLKNSGDRSKVDHAIWTIDSLYEQENAKK